MQVTIVTILAAVSILMLHGQVSFALSNLMGEWFDHSYPSEELKDIAKWATQTLTAEFGEIFININHIDNIQTQIVYGINYRFSIDILIRDVFDHAFKIKRCQLEIFDQPWKKIRHFTKTPTCEYTSFKDHFDMYEFPRLLHLL